jgi:uncharacterized membrane protein
VSPVEQCVWELLFSHHPPEHLHRTVCVRFRHHSLHICARCLGAVVGLAAALFLGTLHCWPRLSPGLISFLVLVGVGLGMADFYCQLVHARESTNTRRIVTGMAFGSAVSGSVLAAWCIHPLFLLEVPVLVALYFLIMLARGPSRERVVAHLARYAAYCEHCSNPGTRVGRHRSPTLPLVSTTYSGTEDHEH